VSFCPELLTKISSHKFSAVQVGLWAFGVLAHGRLVEAGRVAGCVFLAFVSVAAALGFLVYGGRLFLMLQRFPIESRGRTKKLREVCHCCWHLRDGSCWRNFCAEAVKDNVSSFGGPVESATARYALFAPAGHYDSCSSCHDDRETAVPMPHMRSSRDSCGLVLKRRSGS